MNEETTTILIDNALATGRVSALDPEERGVQELALALSDDAPEPARDFRLRMDARVAAGFPRRRRIAMPEFAARRPRMAALGAAASILVALVVAVSLGGPGNQQVGGSAGQEGPSALRDAQSKSDASGGSVGSAPAQESAPSAAEPALRAANPEPSVAGGSGAAADSVAPLPPIAPAPPGDDFVGGGNRRVQRSAALELAARQDELNQVGDRVIAVTDRHRGVVMRSSVTTAPGGPAGGSFDLRIPVRNLGAALRDLSALAHVNSRTESADDVTASFVNARTRLQELMADRRGLLRRLERAATDQQAAAIRARLRMVNAQIDSAQRGLAQLRRQTSYAAVSVTLVPKNGESGGGGIGDGARDLRDTLIDSANIALRVLGFAIPIGLVAALLLGLNAWTARRRREAVLDA